MRFLATCLFMMTVLLFGMLFGIYQVTEMTGEVSEQKVVQTEQPQVESKPTIQIEGSIQRNEMSLLEKQARAKEIQAMNVYSELGETLGNGVEHVFKQVLTAATTGVNDLINRQ